jgi:DNA polymerase-3 subunit epsilon
MTGITNDMVKDAPKIKEILPKLLKFIKTDLIVAHNANFDINFLYDACLELEPPIHFMNDFVDTLKISRKLFPEYRHNKLEDLVERFGIKKAVQHRASSDALQTQKCYEYMKNYTKIRNSNVFLCK